MFNIQINERGQITIPKAIREKANLHPKDNLLAEVDEQGRLILVKKDFFADIEDLIKRDLINQGYTEKELIVQLSKRKKELAKALLKLANDAKKEIDEGNFSTLDDLKEELSSEKN